MTENVITPPRRKTIEDMTIRNFDGRTRVRPARIDLRLEAAAIGVEPWSLCGA